MQYKYIKEQVDYSDFASGRVFYSLSGHPAFPVRLASEIFQPCVVSRKKIYNDSRPCTLYDPCCGAAYHLSVLAYLYREHIREVIGSDIDEKAVALASQNLGLPLVWINASAKSLQCTTCTTKIHTKMLWQARMF
jgi:23S rRNA (guanine2535-N1)-methyltransferase